MTMIKVELTNLREYESSVFKMDQRVRAQRRAKPSVKSVWNLRLK